MKFWPGGPQIQRVQGILTLGLVKCQSPTASERLVPEQPANLSRYVARCAQVEMPIGG